MSRETCIKCGNIVSSSYLSDRCCCGGKFEPYEEGSIQELKSALAAEKKRREEAEEEASNIADSYDILKSAWASDLGKISTLRAENERMREALEFYARDGWTGPDAYPFIPWIMADKGAKALAALAEHEGALK